MAKVNTYTYKDPNAGDLVRTHEGDSYSIFAYDVCNGGQAIKVFDGGTELIFSCYKPNSLVITPIQVRYDCLNGACIKKTIHNTPGLYQSLSECEVACGTGCSGKCISNSEWSEIEGLSNQVRNRNCS
ncbi:hypothetical protein LC612_07560 [Nostoc sp. CHAB 5834]|nr:hypothetical protein [Nostoc sp. CHAB 5834]